MRVHDEAAPPTAQLAGLGAEAAACMMAVFCNAENWKTCTVASGLTDIE